MSKILINLIGKETIPNYHAYKEIKPDILIQVFSDFSKKASDLIESMVNREETEVISIECDGWNFINLLEKLRSNVKLITNDYLFVNVTGGTKMMALPIYEFAKEQPSGIIVKLFYTTTNSEIVWFLEKGNISYLKSKLSIEELIALQGQKIKSKINFEEIITQFEKPLNVIKTEWESKNSRWNQFLKLINKIYRQHNEGPSLTFESFKDVINSSNDDFSVDELEKGIYLNFKGSVFLKFEHYRDNILWFLIKGGWFEILAAQKTIQLFPKNEIMLNVIFNFKTDQERIKNEVDILMSDGNKLLFFECKSGIISSKDLDSIKIRNDIYGGLIGKSTLIGRYQLNSTSNFLVEKAEEYKIAFVTYKDL